MFRFVFFLLMPAISADSVAASISGAGSSAAAPLYQKWARAFTEKTAITLDYQASGSSAGIKKIQERTVDFGASDVALSVADLKKNKLIQFPSAISGVVPVINLPGIKAGQLRLSGEILAQIFSRKITQWNATEISTLNPHLKLPNRAIEVVVRQDGSGTTYTFTDYLSKIDKDWQRVYGRNFSIAWQADLIRVKGSSGVAAQVKKAAYSIGYVDFNYVVQDKLDYVQLKNRDGFFIAPGAVTFGAALNASGWKKTGRFEEMLTNKAGDDAWPISMGTFILMAQHASNPERAINALKLFSWAFMSGDHFVNSVDFVRLPDQVQARVFNVMTTVTDQAGKPLQWNAYSEPQ